MIQVKHFLFLQGMQSRFFRQVGTYLNDAGCRVSRINLCSGDWLFWNGPQTANYRGSLEDWPTFISEFFVNSQVTHLVLVGEQRRYHKEAVCAAHSHGVLVLATDFGYLRPDWIALERDGLNGSSRLPKDLQLIKKSSEGMVSVDRGPIFRDSEIKMILSDLAYVTANTLNSMFFPHYIQSDMRPSILKGYAYSLKKWLSLAVNYRSTQEFAERARLGEFPFYIFAMQLEHDFQIVRYSHYEGMVEPLRQVISSFAQYRAPGVHLIVKNHPRDLGIKPWRKLVKRLASDHGLGEYVHFVDGGTSLDTFLFEALGLVTVNSTSGIRALDLGCPVKTLSSAVYDMEGLTFQGSLEQFWTESVGPDPESVEVFLNFIAQKMHVRGVFFNEPGLTEGARAFTARLLSNQLERID